MLCIALLLGALDVWLYPRFHQPTGPGHNIGQNGIWLRYTWYFGEHTPADWDTLAGRLTATGTRYAYFHVRAVDKTGALRFDYPDRAKALNDNLRRRAPTITRIAWIYAGASDLRLSDATVRARMVAEASSLVRNAGFDGVQWDYEPCPDSDPSFPLLLQETRAALPTGAIVAAAVPICFPKIGWSEDYFAEVSRSCDQLAVMCYDTGFVVPRAYVWLVSEQVVRITRAVGRANLECRVVFGLPAYDNGLRSHWSHAENLAMGLRGVEQGLDSGRADLRVFSGIAPFAEYTMDDAEWSLLERRWARPDPVR